MTRGPRFASKTWVVFLGIVLLPLGAWADSAGSITHLNGTLSAQKPDGSKKILSQKSQVQPGDVLATEDGSYAQVKFTDGSQVTLRPNSRFKIDEYKHEESKPKEDKAFFSLIKGGFRALSGLVGKRGDQDAYRVNTVNATIGIRGTIYTALHCQGDCAGLGPGGGNLPDGLHVEVPDGSIIVINNTGPQLYAAGQYGYVRDRDSRPEISDRPRGIDFRTPEGYPRGVREKSGEEQRRDSRDCVIR